MEDFLPGIQLIAELASSRLAPDRLVVRSYLFHSEYAPDEKDLSMASECQAQSM